MFRSRPYSRVHTSRPPPAPTPRPAPGYTTQRLPWGSSVWCFMHTLCAKVRPESYLEIRAGLWNVILSICQNLPCPDCAAHATDYLRGVRIDTLHTAQDFEHMLFTFHNAVNARKLNPPFPEDLLHSTYSEKHWNEVVPPFIAVFQHSYGPMLNMFQNAHRRTLLNNILKWVRTHRPYFE